MTKPKRRIQKKILEEVLVKSRRRCALCFQSGDTESKIGDIVHIHPIISGGTNSLDNLVFLCSTHNYEFDRIYGQEPTTVENIKVARNNLYNAIELEETVSHPSQSRVFIVHGQDQVAKVELLTFIHKIGLEPVVLSERPSLGQTVLEKLESNANVNYAIILLTPDEPLRRNQERGSSLGAARPNVIFELGYFMGRLGRHRVCALYKPTVELPSDFHGSLYIELDAQGRWKKALARELRDANLPVSLSGIA